MSDFAKKPTHPLRRHGRGIVAAALLAVLAGCDSSGPVEDVFLFEGRLVTAGSVTHSLVTVDEGIARITVSALQPRLIDVTLGANLVIGIGLGQPGEVQCQTSFRANARLGSVFSIGLEEETEYCLVVFDPGSLPEDAVVDYTITVSAG